MPQAASSAEEDVNLTSHGNTANHFQYMYIYGDWVLRHVV